MGNKSKIVMLVILSAAMSLAAVAGEKEDLQRLETCTNEMISLRRDAAETGNVNNPIAFKAEVKRAECKNRTVDFKKKYGKVAVCVWTKYQTGACSAK